MPSGYSSSASGAVLTPERVVEALFAPLAARSVVLQAMPADRLFDSLGGAPLRIPKIASLDLVDPWRSENTLIQEVNPVFDELVLLPSSLKSLKTIHRISNELARNSIGNIELLLGDAFIQAIARAWDAAALAGTGAAGTVTGIANQSGIQTMAAVGVPSIDDLFAAEALLLGANGSPESSVWFMSPRSFSTLRMQREGAGTGQYLLSPDLSQPGRMSLLGHPIFVSTQIPNTGGAGTNESSILLVDMSQVAVGRDLEPRVDVLTERYGDFDQIAIRAVCRMDVGLLNASAVVRLSGVTA